MATRRSGHVGLTHTNWPPRKPGRFRATHEAIVGVGKQWSGARALEALLTVGGELRGPPLQLDTGQLLKIAKRGGVTAVEAVHTWRNALTGAPLNLTPDQVVAIASNGGGKPALESLVAQLSRPDPALAALTNDHLVTLACLGGRPALDAVKKGLPHAPTLIRRRVGRDWCKKQPKVS